ncbi:P-loop containing nucleoside triphosphate hydrolase protein [Amylostereum chailletii]|nr:P-loop containing nucleoside triphosphate hydrolase protein [Amylostereum chailletii]
MTTLQTFQTEIDAIRRKAQAEKARDPLPAHAPVVSSKTPKANTYKDIKLEPPPSPDTPAFTLKTKVDTKAPSSTNNPNKADSPKVADPLQSEPAQNTDAGTDVEQEIQSLLLSDTDEHAARARDLLTVLLTRRRGEFLLRVGAQPPRDKLFANEALDDADGWLGPDRTEGEVQALKESLRRAVEEVGGKAGGQHPRACILLRFPPADVSSTAEVRCAIVGNVDSGKSTTLGVLTRGGLDDGRGLARVVLFRHKHEIETGRTSSVGMEILGFDTGGVPVLPEHSGSMDMDVLRREKLGWEEISLRSAKIITFIDLAGHERYLKTTLYGLTSGAPSCVILMVGANAGVIGMSKEHLAISLALNVPVVVCITKIDMTPPNKLNETLKQVEKILKSPGCRKTPVFVNSTEVAIRVSQVYAKERIAPIFQISNVTGSGLDHIRTFLNLLPSSEDDAEKFDASQPLEFSITEVWSVPYVGTVVNGILNSGTVKTGDSILFGPDANGQYMPTVVKSMQRKRADVVSAEAGQTVALALKRTRRAAVRKGMIIVHKTDAPPRPIRRFEGQVLILYHNTTMQPNYQAMLHCGAVRQTVRIMSINHPQGLLRTGDRATVEFEFISHPEFVKKGMKLLFREGKTKGLGVITHLL